MEQKDDRELLGCYARTRDAAAFALLVRRYAGLVYGTAVRITRNGEDARKIVDELQAKHPQASCLATLAAMQRSGVW
jgi:hypothetical protein